MIERHVQLATVNTDLRKGVSAEPSARLFENALAEAVEERAFPVLDAESCDPVPQPKRGHFPYCMGQKRNADTHFPQIRRRLVNGGAETPRMKIERQSQPGNAAADDRDIRIGTSCCAHFATLILLP